LPPQLVPELIEAGARVYIKESKARKKVMIITEGTNKRYLKTTGNRKQSNSVIYTYISN